MAAGSISFSVPNGKVPRVPKVGSISKAKGTQLALKETGKVRYLGILPPTGD